MESKNLKEIFKIQTINFINELLLVFNNDTLLENIKEKIIIQFRDEYFFNNLRNKFSKNIEDGINQKKIELILDSNKYLLPINEENIAKIKLKSYWNKLENKNKESSWSYLKFLLDIYKQL
tara:strand:- start:702 stop:1064 length:363 start_codon:yes stop_codon:yes gene_type:complete